MKLLTSLVAQMVKNPTAMRGTWVWSLSCDNPLKDGKATHSSILAWRIPMDWGAWQATVHGVTERQTRLSTAQSSIEHEVFIWELPYYYFFFCQSLPSLSSGCYLHFAGFAVCWSSRVRSEMVTPSLSVFPSGREHCCPLMSCSPGMVELKVVGREQKTVQVWRGDI